MKKILRKGRENNRSGSGPSAADAGETEDLDSTAKRLVATEKHLRDLAKSLTKLSVDMSGLLISFKAAVDDILFLGNSQNYPVGDLCVQIGVSLSGAYSALESLPRTFTDTSVDIDSFRAAMLRPVLDRYTRMERDRAKVMKSESKRTAEGYEYGLSGMTAIGSTGTIDDLNNVEEHDVEAALMAVDLCKQSILVDIMLSFLRSVRGCAFSALSSVEKTNGLEDTTRDALRTRADDRTAAAEFASRWLLNAAGPKHSARQSVRLQNIRDLSPYSEAVSGESILSSITSPRSSNPAIDPGDATPFPSLGSSIKSSGEGSRIGSPNNANGVRAKGMPQTTSSESLSLAHLMPALKGRNVANSGMPGSPRESQLPLLADRPMMFGTPVKAILAFEGRDIPQCPRIVDALSASILDNANAEWIPELYLSKYEGDPTLSKLDEEIDRTKIALDEGQQISSAVKDLSSPAIAAELLRLFVQDIPGGLIPLEKMLVLSTSLSSTEDSVTRELYQSIFTSLPAAHLPILRKIVLVHSELTRRASGGYDASSLFAAVFGQCMVRGGSGSQRKRFIHILRKLIEIATSDLFDNVQLPFRPYRSAVLYDFASSSAEEVSVRSGVDVWVFSAWDLEWVYVSYGERIGLLPADYLQVKPPLRVLECPLSSSP